MSRRAWILAACTLIVAVGLAVAAFLFRSETYDNPEIGVITYKYEWGKRAWQLQDSNRDGRIDAKARLGSDEHHAERIWEDRDHDGTYELLIELEDQKIVALQIDEDKDGEFDRSLYGEDASRYWAEHFREATRGREGALE